VFGGLIRRTAGTLIAAIGFALALAPGAQAAKPVQVRCGDVITADTKLANDLVDCPRHGLIIGAAGITLDLNGHTIDGDDSPFEPCPEDEPCDVGIANSGIRDGTAFNGDGYPGVTIENGSVQGFTEIGVYVLDTSDNRVRRVRTSGSDFEGEGIIYAGCPGCRIEDSAASGYSAGFVVTRSHDVRVQGNTVSANRDAGVIVANSDHVTVARNLAFDQADGDGIQLSAGADDNVVTDNVAFGNGGGIGILGSRGNLVDRNMLRDNGFSGAYLLGADANRVQRNTIVRNGDGSEGGVHVLSDDAGESSDDNTIERNTLNANVGDGLLVDEGQVGTLVERNLAGENTDDGIDVGSPATTLTRNTADRNGDLGIEAVPGVVDGGRNRAHGNGNPLQCTHVVCG
jgi:parallel beta-helix repeat protein